MDNWDSEYYKTHALAQERSGREVIDQHSFSGNERILDLGCGDGKLTYYLARKVPQGGVVGLDVSERMIAQASKDYAEVSNLKFVQMGAEAFAFEKPFDLITSFNALHWVEDHAKVLACAKKGLNPGGKILFFMVSGSGNPKVGEVFTREPWRSHLESMEERYFRMGKLDYEALLLQAGLEKERLEVMNCTHPFSNIADLSDHFMTWLPYAVNLPTSRCKDLALELAENIAGEKKTDLLYSNSMLLVKAKVV